jgi:hypothetical protein
MGLPVWVMLAIVYQESSLAKMFTVLCAPNGASLLYHHWLLNTWFDPTIWSTI